MVKVVQVFFVRDGLEINTDRVKAGLTHQVGEGIMGQKVVEVAGEGRRKVAIVEPFTHGVGMEVVHHQPTAGAQKSKDRAGSTGFVCDVMEGELVGDVVKTTVGQGWGGAVGLYPVNITGFGTGLTEHAVREIEADHEGIGQMAAVGDELIASAAAHVEDSPGRLIRGESDQVRVRLFVAIGLGVVEMGDSVVVDLSRWRRRHGETPLAMAGSG